MQRTYHRHMHVLCLSLQSLWTLLCWRSWVVFLCLWRIWFIQFFLASFFRISCDPMERTKWRSVMRALSLSAQYLVVSLCVCSHQLAAEVPLMMIVLSSYLWVPKNTIRNHFIDYFSVLGLALPILQVVVIQVAFSMSSLLWHGPQIRPIIVCLLPQVLHLIIFGTFGSGIYHRLKVFWLDWCPIPPL